MLGLRRMETIDEDDGMLGLSFDGMLGLSSDGDGDSDVEDEARVCRTASTPPTRLYMCRLTA